MDRTRPFLVVGANGSVSQGTFETYAEAREKAKRLNKLHSAHGPFKVQQRKFRADDDWRVGGKKS